MGWNGAIAKFLKKQRQNAGIPYLIPVYGLPSLSHLLGLTKKYMRY
jgi:hypothetical protein